MAMATVMLAGTCVALASTTAAAATSASRTLALSTNGEWPGIGKICEPGPGGSSSVRGIGPKTIHIAVFNDASNTIIPGLEVEFVQQAKAFADWCNASGGINGRHIVIDDRDAALFNAAQQAEASCQSDFMAVGGGMAIDAPAVPVRQQCGLGQISGYVVSDASVNASLQVDPTGLSTTSVTSGWFGALAKKYPQAVKKAGMGGTNTPSTLEPEIKYEYGAEAQGWKVADFQEPGESVVDWAPYVEEAQTKGVQALWPASDANMTPYFQAMNTAGYKPAFIALGVQFYNTTTSKAVAANPGLPPVYVETQWWPLEMASQNPSTEQLVSVMHTYAKGDTVDFFDEEGAQSWLLWAKEASACGVNLTVSCVLDKAAAERNWSAGGIQAPVAKLTMSNQNPQPSPCFVLLQAKPNKFVYDKAITRPTQSIWNCDPKNVVPLTAQQQAQVVARS
ncbi:MAG TPA: ABC transporter substrate-binding protein [Acidimicrobiales bacterium]|nr:ABC transporter substrate-binding protein [Acidimicrobiales bacterium]